MKIAFVFTEYQQNILSALILQKNSNIDILFVRKNIKVNRFLQNFVKKIIYYEDIPYSIKNISSFFMEYKRIKYFLSSLTTIEELYSWSFEHPIIRKILIEFKIKNFYLLEDGIGSYINRSVVDLSLKEFLYIQLMNKTIDFLSKRKRVKLWNSITGCSLYEYCFPYIKLDNKIIIKSDDFIKVLSSLNYDYKIKRFDENSLCFIQQALVEMKVVNEKEYINIHIKVLEKIKKLGISKLYWKPHPRTNIYQEKKRLKFINDKFNNYFDIELITDNINIEQLVLFNRDKNIKYLSLFSSSLYVIKKIVNNKEVFYIKNSAFYNKKISEIYEKLGIKGI